MLGRWVKSGEVKPSVDQREDRERQHHIQHRGGMDVSDGVGSTVVALALGVCGVLRLLVLNLEREQCSLHSFFKGYRIVYRLSSIIYRVSCIVYRASSIREQTCPCLEVGCSASSFRVLLMLPSPRCS